MENETLGYVVIWELNNTEIDLAGYEPELFPTKKEARTEIEHLEDYFSQGPYFIARVIKDD